MGVIAIFLLSVFMPVVVQANCLTEIKAPVPHPGKEFAIGLLQYALNLRKDRSVTEQYEHFRAIAEGDTMPVPAETISPADRQLAETAIDGQVEFVVSAQMIPDVASASPETQSIQPYTGYFALTLQSVVFAAEGPNTLILFDMTYAEIDNLMIRVAPVGYSTMLRGTSMMALFRLAMGSDSGQILAELHQRVLSACEGPLQVSTNMVNCR